MERIPFTKEGLEKIKAELAHIKKVERPDNIRAIEEARAHGDLSENAEYHAAKEKQSFLEGKINELESVIGQAEVIDIENGPKDRVVFGRTVLLYNLDTEEEVSYKLLGQYETDPDRGIISIQSPIGMAILGSEVGDEVRVNTPGGITEYEVLEIS